MFSILVKKESATRITITKFFECQLREGVKGQEAG